MDIPRIFNITESAHCIHNPITPEKLATLGAALRLESGSRVLDLGSGSGEMLCTWLPPTEDVAKGCLANSISDFLMLPELLASFGHLGYDVVEMVLADQDGWDRYEAAKWLTMRRWLEANPDDELAKEVRAQLTSEPGRYATYTREYLGWGVFALMPL
jgi:hypothetical protein